MRRPWRKSLPRKLFTAVLVTTLVALVICGLGLFAYDLQAYRDRSAAELAVEAKILGYTTQAALQFDDPASATQNVAFLEARQNIRAAAVYGARGQLFASYVRHDVAQTGIPQAPGREGVRIDGDQVSVFHHIVSNGERVGTIYLAEDLGMYARIWSYAAIALAVIVVAMLASAALAAWLQRGITRPILDISGLARDVVEKRDYTVRAMQDATLDVYQEVLSGNPARRLESVAA